MPGWLNAMLWVLAGVMLLLFLSRRRKRRAVR